MLERREHSCQIRNEAFMGNFGAGGRFGIFGIFGHLGLFGISGIQPWLGYPHYVIIGAQNWLVPVILLLLHSDVLMNMVEYRLT